MLREVLITSYIPHTSLIHSSQASLGLGFSVAPILVEYLLFLSQVNCFYKLCNIYFHLYVES